MQYKYPQGTIEEQLSIWDGQERLSGKVRLALLLKERKVGAGQSVEKKKSERREFTNINKLR